MVKTFTDENFEKEVLQSKLPVLVDFWAEWCGPCRALAPTIEKLEKANQGKIIIGKIDVDKNAASPTKYNIQGIPALLLFKNGEVVYQLVGHQSQDKIQHAIDEVCA